jgi:hypothetical protein
MIKFDFADPATGMVRRLSSAILFVLLLLFLIVQTLARLRCFADLRKVRKEVGYSVTATVGNFSMVLRKRYLR